MTVNFLHIEWVRVFDLTGKKWLLFPALLLILFGLESCKGAECAALLTSVSDTDSDCVVDTSDNCPFTYNPLQRDTDENDIGDECEDEEDVAALVTNITPPETEFLYPAPTQTTKANPATNFVPQKNCTAYSVVGCQGHLIETFESPDYRADSPYSLYNPFSTFGSLTGTCSAYNPQSPWPPALYCLDSDQTVTFIGYLSENPFVPKRLAPCPTLDQLGKPDELCQP